MGNAKTNVTKKLVSLLIMSLFITFIPANSVTVHAEDDVNLVLNPSFEEGLSFWSTNNSLAINVDSGGWVPPGGGRNHLGYYSEDEYEANTYQTITDLSNGNYTLTVWGTRTGSFNSVYVYAKDTGTEEVKVNVPDTNAWTKISLPVVVLNGSLTIGFYADGQAGAWLGIDLIEISKDEEEVILDPRGVAVPNRNFELNGAGDMTHWVTTGTAGATTTEAPGYKSAYALKHSAAGDYAVRTYQVLTGLDPGYYSFTGWVQNSGGQDVVYLYGHGSAQSESRTALPVTDTWVKVYVRGIHVAEEGTATIGLHSEGDAGSWAKLDLVELIKDDIPYRLLKGGDASEVSYVEAMGGVYYDRDGNEKEIFQILKENGHDIVRLRVYNNPGKGRGDGAYYRPEGFMDKEDMLRLAKRAKDVGLQIQLSFHYSDYWTNGAVQFIPHDWQEEIAGLATEMDIVEKLKDLLYDYTVEVMEAMEAQGTTPEYVSLGNEMQSGLLFPYGRAAGTSWDNLALFLQTGYDAVKSVSPTSRVILHLDDAGNYGKYETFFDRMIQHEVDYDIIGPSYYPFWTNMDVAHLVQFLNHISEQYDKDIMIMETGFKWNHTLPNGDLGQLSHNGPYPDSASTPDGQRDFMNELFNGLKSVNNGRVIGDLYWDPVMISVPGVGWAYREADDQVDVNVVSNTTLFDFDGKALPVFDAYLYNSEGTDEGIITGTIKGIEGRGISRAEVTLEMGSESLTTYADRQGNYLFSGVPKGANYDVIASKPGYTSGTANIASIDYGELIRNINIEVTGATLSGKVTDENDDPASDAVVRVTVGDETFVTVTDANGLYDLSDLPEGSNITVTASKVGYASGTVGDVELTINETTSDVNLIVTLNSGSISGHVLSEDGTPIDEAQVSVIVDGQTYYSETDEDGSFIIQAVPHGTGYSLIATKSNFVSGEAEDITVSIGEMTDGIVIHLIPNLGQISGTVTNSENQPVAEANVSVFAGGNIHSTFTNSQGEFTLESIPVGDNYTVRASKEGYYDGAIEGVLVLLKQSTNDVHVRLANPITIENHSFEVQGIDKFDIPSWNVAGTEEGTFVQWHASATEGNYVLSTWMEQSHISDVSQTITGLENGDYVLSAWFYSGGEQNELYMYARDHGGEIVKRHIPQTGQMVKFSLDVYVENGQLTIGFYADANTGNWVNVDEVQLGYKGPREDKDNSLTPTIPVQPPPSVRPVVADLNTGVLDEQGDVLTIQTNTVHGETGISVYMPIRQLNEERYEKVKRIKVDTGMATISLATEMLKPYIDSGAANINLIVKAIDPSEILTEVQQVIGDHPVFDFALYVDGNRIDRFEHKAVIVEIPYTLKPGENTHQIVIYYIGDDGQLELIKNGKYNELTGTVVFSPKHFSKYAAAYRPVTFPDLSRLEWAVQGIEALAARGIIQGFPDHTFRPRSTVTRAQFVEILIGAMDVSAETGTSTFSDVDDDEWYTSTIITAEKLGIINGKPDGTFGVRGEISRQDMAVMIYRAMQALGLDTGLINEASASFADNAEISAYALDAVQALSNLGLLQGMGNGTFAPKASTTRAQAAVVLNDLLQFINE